MDVPSLTIYIRTLAGEVFPISLPPVQYAVPASSASLPASWFALYDRLSERYPSVQNERLLLFRGGTMNLLEAGPLQDGECLDLFICDPFVEQWMGSTSCIIGDVSYERACMMWYDARVTDPYPTPASQTVCVFTKEKGSQIAVEGTYVVSDNTQWFHTIYDAFRHFQHRWNESVKGEACTDTIVSHLIHLWNMNHRSDWTHFRKGRYYDY